MFRYILILSTILFLSGCKKEESNIAPLIESILEDVIIEGKSIFRLQKDSFNKTSWRIGIIDSLICDNIDILANVMETNSNEYSQSSFDINALNLKFQNIEIARISTTDVISRGLKYYSSNFLISENLDAIFIISDIYKIATGPGNKEYISVCFKQ